MTPLFNPGYWGRLSKFEVPHSIFQQRQLALSPSAVKVLLILLHIAKGSQRRNTEPVIEVHVSQKRLQERAGLSKNVISNALGQLENNLFLKGIGGQRPRRLYQTIQPGEDGKRSAKWFAPNNKTVLKLRKGRGSNGLSSL